MRRVQDSKPARETGITPRDLSLTMCVLVVSVCTFPFAFECGAILMTASRRLRDALARSQHVWATAVVVILAILVISNDSLKFVLHRNVFATFSTEDFLASRQANFIERIALLLSFSCLLLLGRLAALYHRNGIPKLGMSGVRTALAYFGLVVALVVKWNHFVAPLAFLGNPKTLSWLGFSVIDSNPTAMLMALGLAAFTLCSGTALIFVVQAIKGFVMRQSFRKARGP
jgi:hypothetical protein